MPSLCAGQAVIQFAKEKNTALEYALKFFLSRTAFREEETLYADTSSPLGTCFETFRVLKRVAYRIVEQHCVSFHATAQVKRAKLSCLVLRKPVLPHIYIHQCFAT